MSLEIFEIEQLLRQYRRQNDRDNSKNSDDDNTEEPIHKYDT